MLGYLLIKDFLNKGEFPPIQEICSYSWLTFLAAFWHLLEHLANAILQMASCTDASYNAKQQEQFNAICRQKVKQLLHVLRPHYTKLHFLVFPNVNKATFHLKRVLTFLAVRKLSKRHFASSENKLWW